jgi:hypothetical protein
MLNTTESCRVMMPPSNFGARASTTAWHCGIADVPYAAGEQHFRIEPRL